MLDGMISVLETVVAMEKLGDIAGENGEIKITDIFPNIVFDEKGQVTNLSEIHEYTEEYSDALYDLTKLYKENEQFREGAKNFKINGKSFSEIIGMSP
jgi:uncharacterized protein with PhoU and TrkA domain